MVCACTQIIASRPISARGVLLVRRLFRKNRRARVGRVSRTTFHQVPRAFRTSLKANQDNEAFSRDFSLACTTRFGRRRFRTSAGEPRFPGGACLGGLQGERLLPLATSSSRAVSRSGPSTRKARVSPKGAAAHRPTRFVVALAVFLVSPAANSAVNTSRQHPKGAYNAE